MTHTIPHRGCILALCLTSSCAGAADGGSVIGDPLASRNLDPLLANLGVPLMSAAQGLDAGQWQGGWGLHWASHSHRESAGGLSVEYDGETQRHDLSIAVGLGRGLTLSARIPWIAHSGGSLDPLIDGWHGFWGMPDGARDVQPVDVLRFSLDGPQGFLLEDDRSGLGDVELALALRLWSGGDNAVLAGFAQYKAATGEAEDFTGSGEDSFALGLRYSRGACIWEALRCHGQFGVINVGDPGQAPGGRGTLLFGGVSLAWAFTPELALIGQLELQQQAYEAGPFDEVGAPVLGTLGLRWVPDHRWRLEGQFSEDLNVGSAPDVTFRVSATRAW